MTDEEVVLTAVRRLLDIALMLVPHDKLTALTGEQISVARSIADAAEMAKFGPIPVPSEAMVDDPTDVEAIRGPIDP